MNKKLSCLLQFFLVMLALASPVEACTSIAVGRNASESGNYVFARTEDISSCKAKRLFVSPAGKYAAGQTITHQRLGYKYTFAHDSYKFVSTADMWGDGMPGEPGFIEDFEAFGVNERGLAVTATNTTSLRKEAQVAGNGYAKSGIEEGFLTKILLSEANSAIDAVELCGRLVEKMGVGDNCGFLIFCADADNLWMLETLGRHRWVASRVPDDKFVIVANDIVTDYVDLRDTNNFRGTPDIKTFAVEHGFAVRGGSDADIHAGDVNLAASYGKLNTYYSRGRRWRGYSLFAPSARVALILKNKQTQTYPMYLKPDRKISVADIMQFQRDRYQGTKYDMSAAPRARIDPKTGYDVREHTDPAIRGRYPVYIRPVGVNFQQQAHIVEMLRDCPPQIGARCWMEMSQAEHSVYLPFYGLVTDTHPDSKRQLFDKKYAPDSTYWLFQDIAFHARLNRVKYGRPIQQYWHSYELALAAAQPAVEKKLRALYKQDPAAAARFATKYLLDTTQDAEERARKIGAALREHIRTNPHTLFVVPQ